MSCLKLVPCAFQGDYHISLYVPTALWLLLTVRRQCKLMADKSHTTKFQPDLSHWGSKSTASYEPYENLALSLPWTDAEIKPNCYQPKISWRRNKMASPVVCAEYKQVTASGCWSFSEACVLQANSFLSSQPWKHKHCLEFLLRMWSQTIAETGEGEV